MSADILPLTDFLLARIAEDEAPRPRDDAHEEWCMDRSLRIENGSCFYCGHPKDPAMVTLVPPPARVLARCKADRRIVALRAEVDEPSSIGERITFPSMRMMLDLAIAHLASVYADHPDYRAEWKP